MSAAFWWPGSGRLSSGWRRGSGCCNGCWPATKILAGLQRPAGGGGGGGGGGWVWWAAAGLLLPTDVSWQLAVGCSALLSWLVSWTLPDGCSVCWRGRQRRPALCLAVLTAGVKLPGLAASFAANAAALQAALSCSGSAASAAAAAVTDGSGELVAGGLSWVITNVLGAAARCTSPAAPGRLRWEMLAGWPGADLGGGGGGMSAEAGTGAAAVGDRLAFLLAASHVCVLLVRGLDGSRATATPAGRPDLVEAAVYAAAALAVVSCCGGQGVVYRLVWVVSAGASGGCGLLCRRRAAATRKLAFESGGADRAGRAQMDFRGPSSGLPQ